VIPLVALAVVCWAAPRDPKLTALERQVFLLVNSERTWRGLAALKWDEKLAEEARRQAHNMATRWFFSHVDPVRGDLPDRLSKAGISWSKCAENLFQEQGYGDPGRQAVLSWMKSPGHRKNVLDKELTHAGTGAAWRSDGTLFVAEIYTRK
jgi:uncharacterized protein YkwD